MATRLQVGALIGGKLVPVEEISKVTLDIGCSVEINGAADAALRESLAEVVHRAVAEYLLAHNKTFVIDGVAIHRKEDL